MTKDPQQAREAVEATYRDDARRVFATLVRLLGDFDRAEEALHEAFRLALEHWPRDGVPANPRGWLVSTGRFRAIDAIRREARFEALGDTDELIDPASEAGTWHDRESIEDDRLRLVFTCCHPMLTPEAQVALTLREVCGLTTEAIARAFLIGAPAVAQRIVRAKARLRDAKIPYEVPPSHALPQRLDAVLRVVYLVFNEGYSPHAGDAPTRHDLSGEAIRLGRLIVQLLPAPEAQGLLALMLLHESRRAARSNAEGELILLEDQDRSQWNQPLIDEGLVLVQTAFSSRRFGSYTLQAAIAGVHAQARTAADTDWREIVGLYDVLMGHEPSPVVALNRAVAVAMRDGPQEGLILVERLMASGALARYHLAHAARAELCRRLARFDDARQAFTQALALARQGPERRFLQRRLDAMETT